MATMEEREMKEQTKLLHSIEKQLKMHTEALKQLIHTQFEIGLLLKKFEKELIKEDQNG